MNAHPTQTQTQNPRRAQAPRRHERPPNKGQYLQLNRTINPFNHFFSCFSDLIFFFSAGFEIFGYFRVFLEGKGEASDFAMVDEFTDMPQVRMSVVKGERKEGDEGEGGVQVENPIPRPSRPRGYHSGQNVSKKIVCREWHPRNSKLFLIPFLVFLKIFWCFVF
jgi:hypothetical protein